MNSFHVAIEVINLSDRCRQHVVLVASSFIICIKFTNIRSIEEEVFDFQSIGRLIVGKPRSDLPRICPVVDRAS